MSGLVVIASDHRGIDLKREVIEFLKSRSVQVKDLGTGSSESVDYPDYAKKAAEAVSHGRAERGIVICHSGIGVSVTANKIKGVRAALCQSEEQASLARLHTDANVLALPAGFVSPDLARKIVAKWLDTEFEGGRHLKRLKIVEHIEDEQKTTRKKAKKERRN